MRRTGGFRAMADFEAFSRTLEEEGYSIEVKPFGALKCIAVKSDTISMELYLREANVPDEDTELTPKDKRLLEVVVAKYPTEGKPKMQFSC